MRQQLSLAAQQIKQQLAIQQPLSSAVILGSGLDSIKAIICEHLCNIRSLDYTDIDALVNTTAPTHAGKLIIGELNSQSIAICQGRFHLYEGYTAEQVSALVYLLYFLGTQNLLISNAAGALNADFQAGDIMLINDHINLTTHNPLVGIDDKINSRFVDMSQAYNKDLLAQAEQHCQQLAIDYHQGIYASVLGPSLETNAERRMLALLGADAVGMSTALEVIAANHCAIKVLGISAITNMALGNQQQQVDSIEQVLHYAAIAAEKMQLLMLNMIKQG